MKCGYVYILTNRPEGVLYIGVTEDLAKRVAQHRSGAVSSFTKRYNCHHLVWFERFENIHDARLFERRMKKWNRDWKIARIEERNQAWQDLSHALL
ncbi:GIY-YIG nuclease superfamily protein [Croceibacterium atlanticum]|uniref:GIY-YIG nuclease superfamily protein n=1 Tax=Croceibacterium atlanticum TaxID=1267766 RepID=A0A0F7KPX0_9SPHN|nr:GIY-YIG nuclease family protein [Croceibacterium atlanticum]AKH41181.1 GIY-YIG nuclease superfamily protein [Croceibacterium atlanticum]